MKESASIPELRFPEFKGEWKKKSTVEITDRVTNPVNVNNIALYEKRWRKWIRINHPDRGGKDTELCAELINAWDHRSEILS